MPDVEVEVVQLALRNGVARERATPCGTKPLLGRRRLSSEQLSLVSRLEELHEIFGAASGYACGFQGDHDLTDYTVLAASDYMIVARELDGLHRGLAGDDPTVPVWDDGVALTILSRHLHQLVVQGSRQFRERDYCVVF